MMRASESSQDHVGHNNEGSFYSTETTLLTHCIAHERGAMAKTPCTKLTLPSGSEKKHKGVFAAN